MTTIAELAGLCFSQVTIPGQMSQEELDSLGLMIDRCEELEIYMDTNLSREDRKDAEVEFDSLTDRINEMIARV